MSSLMRIVEPTQVYLGTDAAGKERFCQYISTKETLKSLFRQSGVETNITKSKNYTPTNLVVEDVADGKNVKENLKGLLLHCLSFFTRMRLKL